MASSQIDFSSPSSTFGLRSHSLRDRWINRDSKSNASAFRNFKEFVESFSGQQDKKSFSPIDSSSNVASQNDVHDKNCKNSDEEISHAELFVHVPTYKKNDEDDVASQNDVHNKNTNNNDKHLSHADLFVHVPTYKKNENENLANETEFVSSSNDCMPRSAPGTPASTGGVSSLVRRWRDFEAEAKNSANNSPMASRTNSVESSYTNNSNNILENGDNESSLVDGFGDQMVSRGRVSDASRPSDALEKEKEKEKEKTRAQMVSRGRESDASRPSDASEKTRVQMVSRPSNPSEKEEEKEEEKERVQMVPRGRESDASRPSDASEKEKEKEKEKTMVKKLIHKLTSTAAGAASGGANDENGNGNEPNSPSCIGSPRLRGRQAIGDFLMVMQKDRDNEIDGLVERKVVSRFSQKGRIQALLRVQLLRGAMETKDVRKSNGTSMEVNRTPQSAIKRLSERFKPVSQNPAPELKSLKKDVTDSSKVEKSDIKSTHQQEVATPCTPTNEAQITQNKESLAKSIIVEEKKEESCSRNSHEEPSSRPNSNQENISCSVSQPIETCVLSTDSDTTLRVDLQEKEDAKGGVDHRRNDSIDTPEQEKEEAKGGVDHRRNDSIDTQEEWEEVMSNQYLTESEQGWVSDVSHTQAGWDELHSDYEQQAEGMQDWIWDVSRPRSEWEGLRQERYQEMLDPFKQKEDIRRLLESQSVSSFLSSGLRDTIDRLMISRTQQQSSKIESQTDEQVVVEEEEEEEKFDYRVASEHEVDEGVIKDDEGGDAGYYEDDEDEEDEIEVEEEDVDQTSSSLPFASWNTHHGPQTSDFSDQVGFSPLQHNSTPCSQAPSSMTNQSLIEMQFIYDLEGHMEKLHQEVFELRKSMKSCMNMQHKLRRSVKQDVVEALSHSGQNRGRHSSQKKGLINKSMCRICQGDQADSLLYRCGHMCTCFKCAHELQRGSGKCPVCQAPIIDIVQVQADS